MATIIWIEKGDGSSWIAHALKGAFKSSCILDAFLFKYGMQAVKDIASVLRAQGVTSIVVIEKKYISKLLEGFKVLPYGVDKRFVEDDEFIIHQPTDKVNERDLVVKAVLDRLKLKKIIKSLGALP